MKFYSFILVLFLLVTVYGKIRKVRTSLNTESAKTNEALKETETENGCILIKTF